MNPYFHWILSRTNLTRSISDEIVHLGIDESIATVATEIIHQLNTPLIRLDCRRISQFRNLVRPSGVVNPRIDPIGNFRH